MTANQAVPALASEAGPARMVAAAEAYFHCTVPYSPEGPPRTVGELAVALTRQLRGSLIHFTPSSIKTVENVIADAGFSLSGFWDQDLNEVVPRYRRKSVSAEISRKMGSDVDCIGLSRPLAAIHLLVTIVTLGALLFWWFYLLFTGTAPAMNFFLGKFCGIVLIVGVGIGIACVYSLILRKLFPSFDPTTCTLALVANKFALHATSPVQPEEWTEAIVLLHLQRVADSMQDRPSRPLKPAMPLSNFDTLM